MEISEQIKEVLRNHNGLEYHLEKNELCGNLILPDGDSYEVLMKLDPYPRFFPTVYETGGRIPIKLDRHMYTDSGSCCFTTGAKSQVLLKTEITSILKFIDEIALRYFENNSYFEINGKYFNSEYSHGSLGVVQSYQDILGVNDNKSIALLMLQRLKNKKLRIRDLCYCNSGQTLKRCSNGLHSRNYRKFRFIDKGVLNNDINHFKRVLGF
ncbi:MAG: hypothetical protein MK211_00350 [Flavobacteriales bacterium]|nr:hypothetical protein [Flavobacteriales bacterium]